MITHLYLYLVIDEKKSCVSFVLNFLFLYIINCMAAEREEQIISET